MTRSIWPKRCKKLTILAKSNYGGSPSALAKKTVKIHLNAHSQQ